MIFIFDYKNLHISTTGCKHHLPTKHTCLMLSTIWDDIDAEAEAIRITPTNYDPCSLMNSLYDVIDNKIERRRRIKQSTTKGLYAELDAIRKHRDIIHNDSDINILVSAIFRPDEISSITPLDRVFLNSYYRRLLRAKLEQDYIGKELVAGQIITEYTNHQTDMSIVETLRMLRVICKYLGITSTIDTSPFPLDKLYSPIFWASISSNFIRLFGENRIGVIEKDDPLPNDNIEAIIMHQGQKSIRQMQILMLLNVIFNGWSGSTLTLNGNTVNVIPSKYVSRMIFKLR